MKPRRVLALGVALSVMATGAACAKNQDKLHLLDTLDKSSHASGVFRYSDETPGSPFSKAQSVAVRGLIEDDFRYKARLTVDSNDVLDEVVNDDALAVRFLDPSYVPKFTGSGGKPDTIAALNARYWVADLKGAPAIGDAAVEDALIGVDPVVDSLSVVDYVKDAVNQAREVKKFNAESLDYRPAEDPFPRPAPVSGVVRWDLVPKPMPRPDELATGQGNSALARAEVFRKMAIYIKDGRVVQVREQLAAKFDLLDKFRDYIERLLDKAGGKANMQLKAQVESVKDDPTALEPFLNFILNIALQQAGESPVRFRSMKFEFARQGDKVRADLPSGSQVKLGSLDFFGTNSAAKAKQAGGGSGATTTTSAPTTTIAP
jgi:hypothetical protein